MTRKRNKDKADTANAEDESAKNTGQTPTENLPAQDFEFYDQYFKKKHSPTDEYQCSGNVEIDFPGLCALLDMKDIPAVCTKQPASLTTETEEEDTDDNKSLIDDSSIWPKPCLQVELESEDPLSTKNLKVSGWRVDEQIARVLQKMLLSLSKLQSLHLTHLSLRNNRIGDEGARLIGSALSTIRSANKNLLSLNLAFNCIGDEGAAHIAKTLAEFALTHEEVVERRKLLLERTQDVCAAMSNIDTHPTLKCMQILNMNMSSSDLSTFWIHSLCHLSVIFEVPSSTSLSASKGENKAKKKVTSSEAVVFFKNFRGICAPDIKVPQSKGGKQGSKEKLTAQEDKPTTALNERNLFSPDCELYVKIKELMALRDALNKNTSEQTEDEGQGT
ncbi:Leucine-rich repeat-containing protein 71 [Collichthys lucidus]|uniref:Leucine-rich repeat-containing protein 71 n=1 Tax=Collichthys lucidus TaxID=240159 RepID=A0A4U5VKJ9_COLLU|nr:Leucine-rich repeat-containing protein 71 [Collichthys lucidus]